MRLFRRIMLIFILVICVYGTYGKVSSVELDGDGTFYIPEGTTDTYCKVLDDNIVITNTNGLANAYYNLKQDGYTVYNEIITDNSVDVIFTKDGYPTYRYYYQHPQGKVTIFSSQYETSYTGISYMSVRKEE